MDRWTLSVFMGSGNVGSAGDRSLCVKSDQFRRRRWALLRESRPALAPVHRRAGRMGLGLHWDIRDPQDRGLDDGIASRRRRRTARAGFEPARRTGLLEGLT